LDSQEPELPAEYSAFAKAWEEFECAHVIAPAEPPRNFKEAMESPERAEWESAMEVELDSIW
jgi:hypothetical protein